MHAAVAFAGHDQVGAAVHAGGDFDLELLLFPDPAFPVTAGADFGHKFLHPLAPGTGGGDLKDAVAAGHHSPAVALGAGGPFRPGLGAAAAAGAAGHYPGHLHGHLGAQGRVQEIQGQIVPEVIARLGPRPATAAEPAAEAEDVSEDVAEGTEDIGEIPEPGKPGGGHALMAVEVIEAPLFRVMEDLISLGGLFELLFGGFIPGIPVRMVFEGYLAVLLLDLVHTGVPGHTQDLVIILFLVCHILLCKSHLYRFYFVT